MRTRYFQDRLQDLEDFDGFLPRWILPRTTIYSPWNGLDATQMLMITDSAWEVKIGVAPQFPPNLLGVADIMIQEGVAEYLDVVKEDYVYFKINMTDLVNRTMNITTDDP